MLRLLCLPILCVLSTAAMGQSPAFAPGLVVHVGTTDGAYEAELATDANRPVLGLALTPEAGARARGVLLDRKLLGRATVLDVVDPKTLSLVSNTASAVVADLDRVGAEGPGEAELLRGVRPGGLLWLRKDGKWASAVKAWPKEYDDWPAYFHDAAGSDLSRDTAVGPVRGLQWHAGDNASKNQVGLRSSCGVIVSAEETEAVGKGHTSGRLVARDAFSGVTLWERTDLPLVNRYAFLLDEERVCVHASRGKHMLALDLRTGKDILALDQGIDLSAHDYTKRVGKSPLWLQVVLHDGVLVQVAEHQIVALDARSGRRLWKKDLGDRQAHLPTVTGGNLVVVQGGASESSRAYLLGWNCCRVDELAAYDLKTGASRWQWPAEITKGPSFGLHLCAGEGVLALCTLDAEGQAKGTEHLLVLDAASGKLRWKKEVGSAGGHGSNRRVLIQRGRVWFTGLREATGFQRDDGADPLKVSYLTSQCQPTRATPNYQFSALFALRLEDNQVFRCEASRACCDIGAFPSNGLVYTTDSNCGCQPFLAGYNAFTSEKPSKPFAGARLFPGRGKPAPTEPTRSWPAADSWPIYMRDAHRSNWSDAPLAADKLRHLWTLSVPDPTEGLPSLRATGWRKNDLTCGPVTAVTAAEGIIVFAVPDLHQVVAVDPATGKEKWRCTADGRVDSPPTIYRGMVLFGTRNGWVYGLNRDTGDLVWRFLAAPCQRQLLANGQPESLWPCFGTVAIHDTLAWVTAGRSTQLDGGIHWYALDPFTGKSAKSGVMDATDTWHPAGGKGTGYQTLTVEFPPDLASPVSLTQDGKQFLMGRAGFDPASGKLLRAGIDFWFTTANNEAHFAGYPIKLERGMGLPACVLPRRWGLLNPGTDDATLYPVPFYGGVLAKVFAFNGPDFVALLSNAPPSGRGGGPDGLKRWRTTFIGKAPVPKMPAELVWKSPDHPDGKKDFDQHLAIVKAGECVLVGAGKKLIVYRYADGTRTAEYALPDVPVYNGVAVADGTVVVACKNGTVTTLRP